MFIGRKIYKRKEFRKIKNKDTQILGHTSLVKWKKSKHYKYDKILWDDNEFVVKPNMFGFSSKFIEVEDNQFITVKKFNFLIFFLILGLLGIFGFYFLFSSLTDSNNIEFPIIGGQEIEDYQDFSDKEQVMDYIEIPSLERVYNLTSDNKEIFLINPDGNTVYFKYTLILNNQEILSTDYIEPNKMIKANIYDLLDEGSYQIKAFISTIDVETLENCNGATLSTTINIKK